MNSIETSVRQLLIALGENPDREGLRETPRRVAKMLSKELLIGRDVELVPILGTTFNEQHQELVVLRDIPFYSLCEHHMLPYHGVVHIGYIPSGKVVGLSKLARLVDVASRRLSIQERLTTMIVETIEAALAPQGTIVIITAEHLCMTMRGIQKPGCSTTTSAVRGVFDTDAVTRAEFLQLIR